MSQLSQRGSRKRFHNSCLPILIIDNKTKASCSVFSGTSETGWFRSPLPCSSSRYCQVAKVMCENSFRLLFSSSLLSNRVSEPGNAASSSPPFLLLPFWSCNLCNVEPRFWPWNGLQMHFRPPPFQGAWKSSAYLLTKFGDDWSSSGSINRVTGTQRDITLYLGEKFMGAVILHGVQHQCLLCCTGNLLTVH